MPLIQIRNVPDDVHRRAKARAAMEGLTLSDLALRALEREIGTPTTAEIAARIRELGQVEDAPEAAGLVRADRDHR